MIKNFWCSRRLLIILSVLGAISALSLFFAPYAIGVSDENIEAKARKFHNIEDSWQVVKNSNENIFAMIFFPPDKSDLVYSIYNKHEGLSKGYFFRIGGKINEIDSGCVQFFFVESQSYVFMSMNRQGICKAEIDDGEHIKTVFLTEDNPFVLVYPANAGNISFFDTEGEIILPVQRYVKQ